MNTKEILKANNLWPEIRWEIKSPGTLFLSGTKYEIRMERCSLNMEWLYLYHGDTRVSSDVSLESIKYSAQNTWQNFWRWGLIHDHIHSFSQQRSHQSHFQANAGRSGA